MALTHAHPGEPVDVAPYGAELSNRQSHALFKSSQLEVLRLVLPAGRSIPPHELSGEITLQCIEGELEIDAEGRTTRLCAGQLLYLSGHSERSLRALGHASALLTIALPGSGRPR